VPDISFPSLFDEAEIGESALDYALSWDQISPVRHRDYGLFDGLVPTLRKLHQDRTGADPDFLYLQDQVTMSAETRGMTSLPLNEEARLDLRESQEAKALSIENKRRVSKGEEPLASLREEEDDDGIQARTDENFASISGPDVNGDDLDVEPSATTEEETDEPDVLLLEASRIVADVLALLPSSSGPPLTAKR
jgi:carboxyl-terminal processing protease